MRIKDVASQVERCNRNPSVPHYPEFTALMVSGPTSSLQVCMSFAKAQSTASFEK